VGREASITTFEAALARCDVLPFDDAAGRLAGRIFADLELRGRPIGMPDVMIAALALQHGLVLPPTTPHISRRFVPSVTRWRGRTGESANVARGI
jgi:predicted nucleic acid-binding protein